MKIAVFVLLSLSVVAFAGSKELKKRKPSQAADSIQIEGDVAERVNRAIWESNEGVLDLCTGTHSCHLVTTCDYDREAVPKYKCVIKTADR